MEILSVADFQMLIQELNGEVGNEFVIIDRRKKLIVGKVKVLEAPQSLALTDKYTKKKVVK